ncbi:MAG: tRNA guanosine(34) transglycosylase Tgt [Chloroflexi bacterium]|nr:tRNA guanosine(34) transglycosylase Tgt [Chloroflexota bacterium]
MGADQRAELKPPLSFALQGLCAQTGARAGVLVTPHGAVSTPAFLPVATQGAVKALTPQEVADTGARIVLGNAYHLYLRPGTEAIRRAGGLHAFMGWPGPILTDSGGFQVFSLAHLRRVEDAGVRFRSHLDGSEHFLTPERAVQIQEELGADIIMALDECPPHDASPPQLEQAVERTSRWAERCRKAQTRPNQALFGILQGGNDPGLRQRSAAVLLALDFPGYALGGLSLGEPKEVMWATVSQAAVLLPSDRPRYLMGVGSPEDIVEGVARGVDLFDSALPTRVARNGGIYTRQGRHSILNFRFQEEHGPLEPGCRCYTCATFSAAYVRHLFKSRELLAYRLATIHNLRFMAGLVGEVRQAILMGAFPAFREAFLRGYRPADATVRAEQKQRWLAARGRGPLR